MTRLDRVIQILDRAIGGPNVNIGVHRAFWRGLTRDQFVAKKVFDLPLVTVSDGRHSNLVKALRGESPFGIDLPTPPADAEFSRMPAGLEAVPEPDIAFIQQWIDDGCPDEPERGQRTSLATDECTHGELAHRRHLVRRSSNRVGRQQQWPDRAHGRTAGHPGSSSCTTRTSIFDASDLLLARAAGPAH